MLLLRGPSLSLDRQGTEQEAEAATFPGPAMSPLPLR